MAEGKSANILIAESLFNDTRAFKKHYLTGFEAARNNS